jgi:hypothetical protein
VGSHRYLRRGKSIERRFEVCFKDGKPHFFLDLSNSSFFSLVVRCEIGNWKKQHPDVEEKKKRKKKNLPMIPRSETVGKRVSVRPCILRLFALAVVLPSALQTCNSNVIQAAHITITLHNASQHFGAWLGLLQSCWPERTICWESEWDGETKPR